MQSLKEHATPLSRHPQPLRQQLVVDQQVQGVLLQRLAFYAGASAIYFAVIQLCTHAILEPELGLAGMLIRFTDETIYWAPGLLLLMPLVAYDMLRVTNRFTGPTMRLRKQMQGLAEGDAVGPLEFRRDDYWQELADSFNALRDEVLRLRAADEAIAQQVDAEPAEAEPADAEPTTADSPTSVRVPPPAPAEASAAQAPQANSPQQAVAPRSTKESDPPADDAISQDMIDRMLATS